MEMQAKHKKVNMVFQLKINITKLCFKLLLFLGIYSLQKGNEESF